MKIAIIGAGAVGSTIAYSLILKNIPADVLLVDTNEKRCRGEILDLQDIQSYNQTCGISAGLFKDARDANIIIIAAGARQEVGQSRMDLIATNKEVITQICNQLIPLRSDAIILMISNPVDILTTHAQRMLNISTNRIFSSGTLLDTQRLLATLSKRYKVAEQSIDVFILGEHGDTQFPAWSTAHIAGVPLCDFESCNQIELDAMAQEVAHRAYEIISCKGSTFFGIASCITTICQAIIHNQNLILPVSCYQKEFDLYLSMPAIIGKQGIEGIVPIKLNTQEYNQLKASAYTIKQRL